MSNTPNSKTSKGPVRWSGFIPIALLSILTILYILFFFDGHLKYWLSKTGGSLNGAKVDIAFLKTSFLNCSFDAVGIEVANPQSPMKNRISIGQIHYQFIFRPILSKKFVIKDAVVSGIRWGTERQTSGELDLPPPKPKGPGWMDKATDNLTRIRKELVAQSSFGQLSELASGNVEAKIERLGDDSASSKKINEIQGELDRANQDWRARVERLPNTKTVEDLKDEVRRLSAERPTAPQEFASVVQRAGELKSKLDAEITDIQRTQATITEQSTSITRGFSKIDDAINEDIAAVRAKLKIPSLNLSDISPALLGPRVTAWVLEAIYWANLSRQYLPKKSKDSATRVEQKRARGTDIHFAPVRAYPTFLLERALIESNVAEDSRAGNVKGEILGLNSHPPSYGKPTRFSLSGDFPAARISGAEISIEIDHVTSKATERAKIQLNGFPIEDAMLSDDPAFKLGIDSASGKASIDILFGDDSIDAKFKGLVAGIRYRSSSNQPQLERILSKVLGQLAAFDLTASVSGPFDNLNVLVSSDLGRRLAQGITAEFEKTLAEVNDRIKSAIDTEFAFRKRDLMAKADLLKRDALQPVEERISQLAELSKVVARVPERLEAEKGRVLKRAEEELGSKVKNLFKR